MHHHPRGHRRHRAPRPDLGAAQSGNRLTGSSPPENPAEPEGAAEGRPAGILYVVATPIGNLEDISLRALRVLREADLIAAEDTRRTRTLLARYDIGTPTTSYFEHNKLRRGPALVARLRAGARVALVTDAGTPGVSDPGFHLVRLARAAGVRVVPVPGASAVVTALSAAGIPGDRFVFEGFLPVKRGRRLTRLRELAALGRPVVLYESPHRVRAALEAIGEAFGPVEVVLARELTKQFEEFRRGTPAEILAALGDAEPRGEVTLVVGVAREPSAEA
ncbi:MAG: 16S rRNA (cytidine(1402)-2'-O)-methyltransferase [Candidatus Rokuibacteriota bacterium]